MDAPIANNTALFDQDGRGNTVLRGSQCRACGQRMFPERVCCVSCYSRDVVPIALGGIGKVDCFTTVHQAPPGYEGPVPYVLAMVLLGNDVHVLAHLTGRAPADWRVGQVVVPTVLRLREPGAARPAVDCHAFRPAS